MFNSSTGKSEMENIFPDYTISSLHKSSVNGIMKGSLWNIANQHIT